MLTLSLAQVAVADETWARKAEALPQLKSADCLGRRRVARAAKAESEAAGVARATEVAGV